MIRAIAATVLALGFAGTALADRDHDRRDRDRWERSNDRHDRNDRYDRNDRRNDRGRYSQERPRYYAPAPRYNYRWQAPRPRGWHPGWREPYGRGYRYWNDNYYYVVPDSPSLNLNFVLPLR